MIPESPAARNTLDIECFETGNRLRTWGIEGCEFTAVFGTFTAVRCAVGWGILSPATESAAEGVEATFATTSSGCNVPHARRDQGLGRLRSPFGGNGYNVAANGCSKHDVGMIARDRVFD